MTALRVYIPKEGEYYREERVIDANGDLELKGISMQVGEYAARARFVYSKPFYYSAEKDGITYSVKLSVDKLPYEGY